MTPAGMKESRRAPQPQTAPRLRLLLYSSLLIDRPYEWATPAIADARRAAARQSLVEILGAARAQHVDAIVCTGDLFDRRTIAPATTHWLIAALRSVGMPILITPGHRDFVGPLGGYSNHQWPENVTVFRSDRFSAVDVADGITIWGAAHTEAHRTRSFLDNFEVDRGGMNLAVFHGAERFGACREPDLDPCAVFDEESIARAGFDHALVGHYRRPHLGNLHTYAGAPLAHDPGDPATGGVVLVTIDRDTIKREYLEVASPALHDVVIDLTGARTVRDVERRVSGALGNRSGTTRLQLVGRLSPEVVLQTEDLLEPLQSSDELLLQWCAEINVDEEDLAGEQTIRGQFVRDVLDDRRLSEERRQRILRIGLRSLAGGEVLGSSL